MARPARLSYYPYKREAREDSLLAGAAVLISSSTVTCMSRSARGASLEAPDSPGATNCSGLMPENSERPPDRPPTEPQVGEITKLLRSVEAATKAATLVRALYLTGLTDFQNVLDMERSLFEQEDDLAESEGLVTQNLISIYRALGGGWDTSQTATAPAP